VRTAPRNALLSLSTALLSLALASGTLLAPPSASAATTREARLLAKVNAARTSHGLAPLRESASLTSYAHAHARQMARRGGLFHTANFNVICCWSAVGENVAYNRTVTRVHVSLMHSPPHRANILNPAFRQVGIGIVKYGGSLWVTQVFRRPR
jgi:uncharacterized protein YkwD